MVWFDQWGAGSTPATGFNVFYLATRMSDDEIVETTIFRTVHTK